MEAIKQTVRVMIPPSIQLKSKAKGYIVGYTFDEEVVERAVDQVKMLCETIGIPSDAMYNAGMKVEVEVNRFNLDKLADVLSMDVIAQLLSSF